MLITGKTIKRSALTLFSCAALFPSVAQAVGLKEHSVITGSAITLGDLFYDLPRDENRILGNAPRPGDELTINAKTLLRIAVALDLPWRPSSIADTVTLRRDATLIEKDVIETRLRDALFDKGVYGEYALSLPAQYQRITLPAHEDATMEVTDLRVDRDRSSFTATIAAPSAKNPIQHFKINGKIHAVITVPVLRENIQSGRLITMKDIEYTKIKERDFTQDTMVDAQSLIGLTARRVLISGRPIRTTEVVAPQVVERGELVTLSLNDGVLNITTQVKALQNGAKGDVIRVLNMSSNTTLQARVISDNDVIIVTN